MYRLSVSSCRSFALTYSHIRFTTWGLDNLASPTNADRASLNHPSQSCITRTPTSKTRLTHLNISSLLNVPPPPPRLFLGVSPSLPYTTAALFRFTAVFFFFFGRVVPALLIALDVLPIASNSRCNLDAISASVSSIPAPPFGPIDGL